MSNFVKDIQRKQIKEAYIKLTRDLNTTIDRNIFRRIDDSVYKAPRGSKIFSKYTFVDGNNINIKELNTKLLTLDIDVKTLLDAINIIYDTIYRIDVVTKVYKHMSVNVTRQLKKEARSFLKGIEIKGISKSINFETDNDEEITTASIIDNSIQLPIVKKDVYVEDVDDDQVNITISAEDEQSITRHKIVGSRSAPFNAETQETCNVVVYTTKMEEVQCIIDVDVRVNILNRLYIECGTSMLGARVDIEISTDGITYKKLPTYYMAEAPLRVYTPTRMRMEKARITFTKGFGYKSSGSEITYDFDIRNIFFSDVLEETNVLYQTQELSFDKPIRNVSIIVDEIIPDGATSTYYISTTGKVNSWVPIEPSNRTEAETNIINIGGNIHTVENIHTDTNRWLIDYEIYGDINLYNILNPNDTLEYETDDSISIVNNKLTHTGNEEIDPLNIKLFRGIGNYGISEGWDVKRQKVDDIFYIPRLLSTSSSYEPIELLLKVTEYLQPLSTDPKVLNLKYPIYENRIDETVVIDSDGYTPNVTVDASNSYQVVVDNNFVYTKLSMTGTLDPNRMYYATYFVSINDKEEVDGKSFVIDETALVVKYSNGEQMNRGVDYILHTGHKELALSASLIGNLDKISIAYEYAEERTKPYNIYTTYIDVDKEAKIKIIPFTNEELSFGNYHKIDNIDVSSEDEYLLSIGSHKIESTQPYPSDPDNDNDVNTLTNKSSLAGIILDWYVDTTKMRALEMSQRLVGARTLANNIKPNDRRSFAYDEGKILLNRIPDYIRQETLNSNLTNHKTGTDLLLKKVEYTESMRFYRYVTVPETFRVIFNTNTENQPNTLYLKVVIDSSQAEEKGHLRIDEIIINNLE